MIGTFNFQEFISAFFVLFAIIDIFGSVPILINITKKRRKIYAGKATLLSLLMFVIFYFNDFDAYGAPYLVPLSPSVKNDLKDYLIKSDLTKLKTRPKSIPNKNTKRQK